MAAPIRIEARLNEAIFRRFAVFHNLLRRYRWLTMLGFLVLMLGFACMNFIAGASLTGWVLLIVPIVLIAGYLLSFWLTVKGQLEAVRVGAGRPVYTLTLQQKAVHVENDKGERADYAYAKCLAVYRVAGAHYLYVRANRAFILPHNDLSAEQVAALDTLLHTAMQARYHDRRGAWARA